MAELIVAFDMDSADAARRLAARLPGLRWAKLGYAMLLGAGPAIVQEFHDRGVKVFLDLKWHDIPNSVAGAVRAAQRLGVDLATVHGIGGTDMVRAAVLARGPMRLAGVSVLTSHTQLSYGAAVGDARDLHTEVRRLAQLLVDAGVDAVVTSPQEIAVVRPIVGPDRWIIVPGIRPPGAARGDQQRTAEPLAAVRAGATHLVVGRPISEASDPQAVYEALCAAIN